MAMIVPGFNDGYTYDGELKHFRTPGSKNGQRKYQYEDGSLTPLGRIHYGIGKPRIPSNPAEMEYKVKSTAARTNYNANHPSSVVSKAVSGVGSYAQTKANYGNQSNTKPYLSEEYKRDMAFNSRKNNYFGNNSSPATSKTTQPQAKANYNSQSNTKPYVSKEYERDMAFNSRKNNFDQLAYEQAQVQSQYDNSWQGQANNLTRSAQRGMSAGVNRVGQMLGSAATEAKKRVSEAADNVKNVTTDAWNATSDVAGSAAKEAKKRVDEAARNVGNAAKGAYDSAREYLTGEKAKQRVDTANKLAAKRGVESNDLTKAAQEQYERNTLPGQVQRAGRIVENAASAVRDAAIDGWNDASQFVSERAGDISNFAITMTDNATTTIDDLKTKAGDLVKSGKEMVDDAIDAAGNAAKAAGDFMGEKIGDVTEAVGGAFSKGAEFAKEAWKIMKWPF